MSYLDFKVDQSFMNNSGLNVRIVQQYLPTILEYQGETGIYSGTLTNHYANTLYYATPHYFVEEY
jgi:hypothetical protein